jgi:hypothetical protein
MKLRFWQRDTRPYAVITWCEEHQAWHFRPVDPIGTLAESVHELKYNHILDAVKAADSAGYRLVA